MKKRAFKLFLLSVIVIGMVGCSTYTKTMKEPAIKVQLHKEDFVFSNQVTAEAKSVKIIGIDWKRLFISKKGTIESSVSDISLASIPVIGNLIINPTANYALYQLMLDNPGYDVVVYPQFETKIESPILGIGFITQITTVKVTARLGKLK